MSIATTDEWNAALAMRGGSSAPYGGRYLAAHVGTWWPYTDCPAPSRTIVGESLWGTYTAMPVHMPSGEPDSFKIYIDGRPAGFVQYDLDSYRYVTRADLHSEPGVLTFTTFGRAVEQVQIANIVGNLHNGTW